MSCLVDDAASGRCDAIFALYHMIVDLLLTRSQRRAADFIAATPMREGKWVVIDGDNFS